MNHFSFQARMRSALVLLAAVVIVAALTIAVTSREASSTSASCTATSLELVGTSGTPSAGVPVIDLTGDYATAETSILNLGSPEKASVEVPLDFDQITVAIESCAIEYDGTAHSVAISGTATNILPGGADDETADLLILATWPDGSPIVSLGGHVDGDFDLARIHSAFQAPEGLKPEFSQVWFSQSSGEQTDPASYAGAGEFYPSGHVIPAGVAFRAELDLSSVIGDVLAGYLGNPTVSIIGGVSVGDGVTIYNDTLVLADEITLGGQIDLSGVGGLPAGISFPSTSWSLTLTLKPSATNDAGQLATFGIQVGITGSMTLDKALLGTENDLVLDMQVNFEWDSASESVVVDLAVTAEGPWNNLFGMEGFSADSVTVALRASTEPDAQSASIRVTGVFTANGFQFALTFQVSEKDGKFSAKVAAESLSDISLADLVETLAQLDQLDQVNMAGDSAWSVLEGVTLTKLKAAVSFGQAGASVFVTADAEVYGLQTSVAFYLGPDKQADSEGGQTSGETKYGFFFGIYIDSVGLGDLVPDLPDSLNLTLPETIFYVSSLKFDADIGGFPDPDLFRFINKVYGTTEDPGAEITVEAGAGLLSNVCAAPIPQSLQDMLEEALWVDFSGCLAFRGNVPLFGKTGISLSLYLPEVTPKESDQAPEWFERALLQLSIGVDLTEVSFKLQGELDIRLRKPGAPEPANFDAIEYDNYDHFQFLASGLVEIKTTPPTVDVTLAGEMEVLGGWHPLGWEALTVEQLALVLNVGTTPDGNAKIGLGLGAAIVLGAGEDRLDLEASFLIGVQTLQVFPWVTANVDGFRFQTERGLQTMDLITLADAFSTSLPEALEFPEEVRQAVVDNLPNIAIRDLEISFAKVDNEPLCLQVGFIVKGSLYVNPTSTPPYVPREPCDPNAPPIVCESAEGCFGAVDIEVSLSPGEIPSVKGKLDLNPFDIGPYIHIGPANVDLEISQASVHLMVHGQMAIDGVGSGLVDLKITPNSYELNAEAKLFDAFWAYLDANMTIVPPAYQAHGELKAEFGTAIASALEGETRNLRALLATLDQLYADFQDPNKDLDDLTDSLINLAPTLQANGADGPLIDLMVAFAAEIQKAKAAAEAAGMYPSLDQIVNVILGGATITITEGTPGWWVYPECVGVYYKGKCYGVWIPKEKTCVTYYDGSTCWFIPPIKFHIPGICPSIINLPAYGYSCNSQGLKNLAADAVDQAFYEIFGEHLGPLLHEMASEELPVLFDVNCAAFDIDLGLQADNTVDLFLGITLLGKPVVWEGTWDFDASLIQNIGNNKTFLINSIKNILGGQTPNVYEKCTHTAPGPPPGGKSGTPTDLTVTAPAQVSEGQAFTLHGAFTEEGVRQGDVRTYAITWGDGNTTTATLPSGQASFDVQYTYADDPVGNNDNQQIAVTVTNARAGSASTSRTIKVVNVNPTAGTPQLSAASVDEGQTVTVTGSFTDPGVPDTHTVLVTWNDGSQPTEAVVNQQNRTYTAQHTYLDDNPTGTAQDTVEISVQITDDDGGKAQTQTSLAVKNVTPQLTSLSVTPLLALEGLSVMTEEPGGEFFEGDQFMVEGEFSDPGSLDTHSVKIEWKADGDWQVFSQAGVEFSQRSFSITLPLPDDDPTGTPEDPVIIRVTVEDDDLGTFSQEFPIILKNRDPEDVIVTPDAASINEDDTVGVTVEWADAGLADTHRIVIDWDDGNQTVLDGIEAGEIEVGEREAQASHHYRDDAKTANPADTYTITATVTDDDTGSGVGNATIVVNDVPPVVSVDTDSQSVQYSDPITDVTVTATDVETDPLSATTSWAGGAVAPTGDLANAGLPDWLTLSADGNCLMDSDANLRTCTWTLSPQLSGAGVHSDAAPGLYTVRVKITDDDTLFTTVDTVIEILPEDAIAYYVGPTFAATVSAREGSADIELRANVRDITTALPGPDAPWDPYPGDIRNATVTFVDVEKSPGDAGYELCSAPVDAIFIVGGQPDTNIGTAECVWHADIGNADAVPFHIGVVVGGHYTNDLFPEQTIVTVAKPIDSFITGGGHLVLEASEGAYAGDDGSRAGFGFNVGFIWKGRYLHGQMTLLFRAGDRAYMIVTNAIESLGVVDPMGKLPWTAQFEAKASLIDVTNPFHPIVLGSNLSLQMTMTDWGWPWGWGWWGWGKAKHADTISFTLWEGKEGRVQRLLFSSAWDGNRTVEQQLAGGNLTVHGKGSAAH